MRSFFSFIFIVLPLSAGASSFRCSLNGSVSILVQGQKAELRLTGMKGQEYQCQKLSFNSSRGTNTEYQCEGEGPQFSLYVVEQGNKVMASIYSEAMELDSELNCRR